VDTPKKSAPGDEPAAQGVESGAEGMAETAGAAGEARLCTHSLAIG
jgi:hypothetical protein